MKFKLHHQREQELLELSDDVANECTQTGRVCPIKICKDKKITVVHGNYGVGKFDGLLALRDGAWTILCNLDNGNTPGSSRERFTIAHELGHYHIPEHRKQLLAGCPSHGSNTGAFDGADSIEELEADTFAANLLMPPKRFVPRLRAVKETPLSAVLRLRQEFDTSLESTAIQTMRHDDGVLVITKWVDESLAWHRIAEMAFKADGYRSFKLKHAFQLQRDCAIAAALRDAEDKYNGGPHDCVAPAYFYFDRVAAGDKRDILIREEAIRNGRFGVLGILSRYLN
ncbi:ImmA/IrrE family metallo-endopeptidase [Prosthecobacter sp.]|uniref:ImmA/IrrE family metallo-endopeptidase n=1 Tax=Prosthecobacter sp. TaxID=1965333 RepID=UPI00378527F2